MYQHQLSPLIKRKFNKRLSEAVPRTNTSSCQNVPKISRLIWLLAVSVLNFLNDPAVILHMADASAWQPNSRASLFLASTIRTVSFWLLIHLMTLKPTANINLTLSDRGQWILTVLPLEKGESNRQSQSVQCWPHTDQNHKCNGDVGFPRSSASPWSSYFSKQLTASETEC